MDNIMGNTTRIAEYYFDYKIKRVLGDEKKIKEPKIYFERDYGADGLPYAMFAVPEEWLEKQSIVNKIKDQQDASVVSKALSELPYDSINIVFDIKGIDCVPLADKTTSQYANAESKREISFDEFYRNGCRLLIESNNTSDHSGVGVIEMIKDGQIVAKFFFAINFTFRKVINYSLVRNGNQLSVNFECKDKPISIPVSITYCKGRIPCLKNDMGVNIVESFELDFTKSSKCHKSIKLSGNATLLDNMFSLSIPNEKLTKYYLLNCYENNTLRISKDKYTIPKLGYTCPYCHRPINSSVVKNGKYKKGGIACQDLDKGKALIDIYGKHKRLQKKCLYCAEDLNFKSGNTMFDERFRRLLPPNFMEHDSFKIAFAGSIRAGKTTYISRFFGLHGTGVEDNAEKKFAKEVGMLMPMAKNSLKKFGISINPAAMAQVNLDNHDWKITDRDWMSANLVYRQRAISLNPSLYPEPTPHMDLTKFPFIAEIMNKNAYVSFYDIAGEDAEGSRQIQNIANNEYIGVFCLINGQKDDSGNAKVINMINSANLTPETPIAVIVTKMDMLESKFDSNCHCLRSNYFDDCGDYEGSVVEREIDFSSEEIKSYLATEGLLPKFEAKYKNIKYFGVSSFNFVDAIHNQLEDINAPGKIKFECSSKRMELPFLWMLKQFAVIN